MPVKILPASGSGSATLISVAGTTTDNTLTLPARTGNIITSADTGTVTGTMLASATVTQSNLASGIAGNGPAFKAGSNAINVATNTNTIFSSYGTPSYNYGSCFDTSTGRFTPNVAGVYILTAIVSYGTNGLGSGGSYTAVRVNFNSNSGGGVFDVALGGGGGFPAVSGSGMGYFNGSTDYAIVSTQHNYSATTNTVFAVFSAALIRSA